MACSERWDVHEDGIIVRLARKAYLVWDKATKRQFLKDRTRYTGHDAPLTGKGAPGTKWSVLNSFWLEEPGHLYNKLRHYVDQPSLSLSTILPKPAHGTTWPVCKLYLKWVFAFSNHFLYPQHQRLNGAVASATDREIVPCPMPVSLIRGAPTTAAVVAWLQDMAKISLILPNNQFQILPFATRLLTHATYVREEEMRLQCPWAMGEDSVYWSAEYEDSIRLDMGDVDLGDAEQFREDAEQREEEAEPLQAKPKRNLCEYRYGNLLCLRKDKLSVHPSIASLNFFRKVWRDPENGVDCLRVRKWIPFAKCDTCCKFRTSDSLCADCAVKRLLRKAQARHILDIKKERLVYTGNKNRGIKRSKEYLSIIVDGADQSDFGLPHSRERSHATEAAWKLGLKLYGVIVHGVGTWAFTCPPHIGQGNNVTIQAIWHVLLEVVAMKGKLPPVLYLQLDNTTKQNKGRYLKAFLAILVHLGLFTRVIVGYLPVGHTHEDIDQLFSRISMYLRTHDAFCLTDFHKCISRAFYGVGGAVKCFHWKTVANISKWLKPYLLPASNLDGLMTFRHFKIFPGGDDQAPWMVVRDSPASAKHDQEDLWRGMADYTTHVVVFPQGVPDLRADMLRGKMPPAARSTASHNSAEFTSRNEKMRRDITALQAHVTGFTDSKLQELLAILDDMEIPNETPIPFNWHVKVPISPCILFFVRKPTRPITYSPQDLDALVKAGSGGKAAVAKAVEVQKWEAKVDDFLLLKPDREQEANTRFWLAKVITLEGSGADRHYLLQYWDLQDQRKSTGGKKPQAAIPGDPLAGDYAPNAHMLQKRSVNCARLA